MHDRRCVTSATARRLPGVATQDTAVAQLRFLVGGFVLIAGLLTVATIAATQLWLSLTAGVLLAVVALAGLRRGVPRLFVLITLGFAAVLLGAAGVQLWAERTSTQPVSDVAFAPRPVLISGTVSESGRLLSGVPVQVTMQPRMDDLEVGESVDLEQLDPVMTDELGRYVVRLAPADVDQAYLLPGRVLNFQVAVSDPMTNPISTSARFPRRGSDWVGVFGDRHAEPKTLDFDLSAMRATETGDGAPHRWPLFRLELHPAPQ